MQTVNRTTINTLIQALFTIWFVLFSSEKEPIILYLIQYRHNDGSYNNAIYAAVSYFDIWS